MYLATRDADLHGQRQRSGWIENCKRDLMASDWLTKDRVALGLAVVALAVYLPAIWWGLPVATNGEVIRGWDVDGIAGIVPLAEFHNMFFHASADWYVPYPLFHYLLLGASYAPYLAWLWLTGGLESPSAVYPYGLMDPVASIAIFASIGRALTLCMALGTILAAYRAASIVWDRRTGIVTALLAMLSVPMVYRARTGNLDVPVLFWTALGVVMLADISMRGLSVRRAVWLGAFAALATATKDQAYGGWVIAILVVMFLHWRRLLPSPGAPADRLWKAPAAIVLSGIVVYAVASGIVVHPDRYLAHMRFILSYEEARFAFEEAGLERGRDFLGLALLGGEIAWTTILTIGIPAAAMAVAGAWSSRKTPFLWLLAGMGAGYLTLVLVPIAHMQLRYSLLLAYLLAFPAACWLCSAYQGSQLSRALARVGGALALAWLLAGASNLTYQMWFDARNDAGDWLSDNLIPGQHVGFFGDKGQLPVIPEGVVVERLDGGPSAFASLQSAPVDVLLIIPDYTTPAGGERSLFLPESDYAALGAGAFPYALVARYETAPPLGERYPFVNPPVQIFARSGPPQGEQAGNLGAR